MLKRSVTCPSDLVAEGDDWTCFTNPNVAGRQPPTQNLHLCLYAREKEQVDAFHRAGVEGSFRSKGEPGYRNYGPGYYAAYLFDPDGNNVEASIATSATSATTQLQRLRGRGIDKLRSIRDYPTLIATGRGRRCGLRGYATY